MFNKKENELVEVEQGAAITPMTLIQTANKQGADLDKMQQLMDLQERWEANEAKKAYVQAMSAFRAECPSIVKTKQGHNSKYAGLAETIDQIKGLLASCGLSHSWRTEQKDGLITVTCIVTHVNGHSESTTLASAPETSGNKNDIQAIGSAVEYLKRYTFFAILGLSSGDEDNDGGKQVEYIDGDQVNLLHSKIEENELDEVKFYSWLKRDLKCDSLENISIQAFKTVNARIDSAIRAQNKDKK